MLVLQRANGTQPPLPCCQWHMCSRAGIGGFRTNHSLRATNATRLFSAGADEQLIMERTGHRSLDGVRSYVRRHPPSGSFGHSEPKGAEDWHTLWNTCPTAVSSAFWTTTPPPAPYSPPLRIWNLTLIRLLSLHHSWFLHHHITLTTTQNPTTLCHM